MKSKLKKYKKYSITKRLLVFIMYIMRVTIDVSLKYLLFQAYFIISTNLTPFYCLIL